MTSVLALVGAITVTGLLLRLPSFNDSLFGDELSTYYVVNGHGLGRVVHLLQGHSVDLNPPLFLALAWATEKLGDSAQALRLTSLLAGTTAIPLTYLLGLWTVGRRAALVGAALTALSPFLIFYSTEARAYALVVLMVLMSALALLQALRTRGAGWWVAYAACSCAAVYTHYTAVFALATQFAWALWAAPRAWRALVAANVAAAVGYLPWLPTLVDNTRSPGAKTIGILEPFGVHAIRVDLAHWSIGHPFIPLASMPGRTATLMIAGGLATGVLGLVLRVWRARAVPTPAPGAVLVAALALATPVGTALYSAIGNSVWEPRNLIVSWPGLALAIGALVTSAAGVLRVVAAGLVIGGFAVGAARMLDVDAQRPDYRAAARLIARAGAVGDPVVEVPFPTPGPLTALGDVALDHYRPSTPPRHEVLRLGGPPLSAELRARPYALLPVPPAQEIAERAATLARGGTVIVFAPGSTPVATLRTANGVTTTAAGLGGFGTGRAPVLIAGVLGQMRPFLEALPPRFRHVETTTFPGFLPISVYVFRDDRAAPRAP
jgi:mannosyltransferase